MSDAEIARLRRDNAQLKKKVADLQVLADGNRKVRRQLGQVCDENTSLRAKLGYR